MAWIYLAESEDSHSLLSRGLSRSRIVNRTDTLNPYYFPGCKQANCLWLRFGMTFEPFSVNTYLSSTSYTADFHARTSALQAVGRAWKESEAVFIGNSTGSSKSAGQLSFLSKIAQPYEQGDYLQWPDPLPRSGMIYGGQFYQPPQLGPHTAVTAASCLPTLTVTEYGTNQGGGAGRVGKVRMSLQTMARKGLLPTLTRRDAESIKKLTRGKNASKGGTPLPIAIGGPLNPEWTEWFMGYPIAWTALEPWATQWFRAKRARHSKSSVG